MSRNSSMYDARKELLKQVDMLYERAWDVIDEKDIELKALTVQLETLTAKFEKAKIFLASAMNIFDNLECREYVSCKFCERQTEACGLSDSFTWEYMKEVRELLGGESS